MAEIKEIWKPVWGLEALYSASNLGNVAAEEYVEQRNYKSGTVLITRPRKILKGYVRKDGRRVVYVRLPGRRPKQMFVSNLVMLAFEGPRTCGMDVCHNDGNPSNDSLENLRYDTRSGNMHDTEKHGTRVYGEKSGVARLTEASIREAKRLRDSGLTYRCIADKLGVATMTVHFAIGSKKTWRHVGDT